jgi:group I intron endonuclease
MGKCKRVAGIYTITNKVNGKKYVGYSESIVRRWNNHRYNLRRNVSGCVHIQSSWNVYGESSFEFSIIEILPDNLTKQEYETVKTKWVLFYKSHLSEYGYNGVLPGTIPSKEEGSNVLLKKVVEYVCIHGNTVVNALGVDGVVSVTGIVNRNKINDITSYWRGKGKSKSKYGWIVVQKEIYNPEFDYIGYKKQKLSSPIKKTWRDYPLCHYVKKAPEDIIPHSKRNLKRISVIAVNISTGEEKVYSMLKECDKDFVKGKVYKCINAPFGKYKHRGHYFKKQQISLYME